MVAFKKKVIIFFRQKRNSTQFNKAESIDLEMSLRPLSIQNTILLILIILSLSVALNAQGHNAKFENISIEKGLSQSTINCILQDSKGFMWFGTEDGLNKYDGYGFKIYKSDPLDSDSLSDSYVLSICEDKAGVLWVGTHSGGLNRFDREKERFTHFKHDSNDPSSLSHNFITSIFEDESGVLWIGTYSGGLNRFDREKGKFKHYKHDPDNSNSLSHDSISSICEDESGTLWIGTSKGLNRFDRAKGKFTRYTHDADNPKNLSNNNVRTIYEDESGVLWVGTDNGLNKLVPSAEESSHSIFIHYKNDPNNRKSLSNNLIRTIYEDKSGVLWVGTYGGGLNRFDRKKEEFTHWIRESGNPSSLGNNFVNSIYEDESGILWVGTFGGGLSKFDREKGRFRHYRNEPNNPASLSTNTIFSIYEDESRVLWIGTYGGGLNRFDREEGKIKHYIHESDNPNSLSNNNVRSICEEKSGVLWIGTFDGLNRFDREKERFSRYRHDPDNPHSLSNNYIRSIYEDGSGVLWIGTAGGGLNRFDREKEKFAHYRHDSDNPGSLSNNRVFSVYEDRTGVLWVGTAGGLNRFDREKKKFTHYTLDPDNPHSLSNDRVFSIYEDRAGVLWIGTYGGGLNKFDREEGKFTRYKEKDGLPNNVIYGILEDDKGNLWISTNKGLSKFNPQTETFRNFDVNDGLQSNEFNSGAYHKSKSGEMFFGGINGFNAFYPGLIKDNPHIPPVVITDFQIFNKSVPVGAEEDGPSILKKSITETETIEISYKERVFSFEFAALDFVSPEKNDYAYMMEGFEEGWNYVGNRRFVTYTNLTPGRYIFRIKASNNDGLWNEIGTSLAIKVKPPFWDTWWFITLVTLGGFSLVYGIHRYRIRLLHKRAKILEQKVKERTSDMTLANKRLQQEISERQGAEEKIAVSLKEKEVLLQEIHHRVKNNLQIISSLLKLQSGNIKNEDVLEMFRASQERVRSMALIHEKLYQSEDLSKIDFTEYISSLTSFLFQSYQVNVNSVKLKMNVENVFLDINKSIPCGLIVNELVSNALKYAFPEGRRGEIDIDFAQGSDNKFSLVVADNGVGFPEDLDFRNTESLGMRLVCILTEQLGGTVELDRKAGTKFTIKF